MGRVSKKMRRQAAIALAKEGYSREAVEQMAIEASKMNVADDILKKAARKEARGRAIAERTLKDFDRAVTQAISTTALMACWALHNTYGFGSKRLKTVLNEFDKVCGVMTAENNDKSDSHPLCWKDIAEALKDETGMDFWEEWRSLPALNDKTTGLAS